MKYSKRLQTKLPSLNYRYWRGDKMKVYKILTNKYYKLVAHALELNKSKRTGGNNSN